MPKYFYHERKSIYPSNLILDIGSQIQKTEHVEDETGQYES